MPTHEYMGIPSLGMAILRRLARSYRTTLSAELHCRLSCCMCMGYCHSTPVLPNIPTQWLNSPKIFDPGGDNYFQKEQRFQDLRRKRIRQPFLSNNEYELTGAGSQGVRSVQRGLSHSRLSHEVRVLCNTGHLDKALQMLVDQGTMPPVDVFTIFLKACSKYGALAQARQLQVYLVRHGLESTSSIGECLVSTLVKCGGLEDALQVFHRLPHRSVFLWTVVLCGKISAGLGREALKMYYLMLIEGVEPDKYIFMCLLRACGSLPDLKEGRQIHAEASRWMLEFDPVVGTCLVDMYAKCGSMVSAESVFYSLPQRNVVTWTVMLGAYAQNGHANKALQLYDRMLDEGVSPNDRTFVILLQACRILVESTAAVDRQSTKAMALEKGRALHAHSRKKGYAADIFVGNSLVSMYGKCGSIVDAKNVFDGLTKRDVISWNAMLSAYVEQGQPQQALQLYDQMSQEDVSPNERTIVSAIQACGMLSEAENCTLDGVDTYLERGREIHVDAKRKGRSANVFVSSSLITLYGKCRSIQDAEDMFEALPTRNLVSWNAMLTAYIQCGLAGKALRLYEQMLRDSISPDTGTYILVIQVCGMLADDEDGVALGGHLTKVKSLVVGKAIHSSAQSKGIARDVFVGNTLVSMYGKCGSTKDAQSVFDELSQQDVVSWTAMLSAYTQHGNAGKALELFEQMLHDNVKPDVRISIAMLQVCGLFAEQEDDVAVSGLLTKVKSLKLGKAMHADLCSKDHKLDVIIGNTLISMYGKCGSILDAHHVFRGLPYKDVVSWNAMLASYSQQGPAEEALELYEEMVKEGDSPDVWTFVSLLQVCGTLAENSELVVIDGESAKASALGMVKALHAHICLKGYDQDVFIGNTLVSVYGKCRSTFDAHRVFTHLPKQDVVSWNALVGAYAQQGQTEKAWQLFEQMTEQGVQYDEITVTGLLQACSDTGNLNVCRQIHRIVSSRGEKLSSLLASSLIHAYGSCANMVDAQSVFETLPAPDVVVWTALIAGYARQGNSSASFALYDGMRLAGVEPDSVTFLSLLSACSHAGQVEKGLEYFESMSRDYGIIPRMEHYVSMVDLLGRAGNFTRMEQLFTSLPMQPDRAMLSCLLGACQKHGKVALGKHAFESAVHLQPNLAAPYVLMSNIYEAAGLTDHASELKSLRQGAGAWKKPGQSWIELQQKVHSFVSGEPEHPRRQLLHDLLSRVSTG